MKTLRNLIVVASAAILSLVGCQEELFNESVGSDKYQAIAEAFSADTKTTLGESRTVVWSSGDQIAILEDSSVGKAYQVTNASVGKTTGEFTMVKNLCTDETSKTAGKTIAIYPFSKNLTISIDLMHSYFYTVLVANGITFPSRQVYTSGSFSEEAFPMAAITENGSRSLAFKNIGGVIKLSLTGTCAIKEITIKGHKDEPLSGPAAVTFGPDGTPSVSMSEDASKSVTLVCDPVVPLDSKNATDFFISIPPTNFKEGFTVTMIDSKGNESTKSTNKAHYVTRSTILAMPDFFAEEMDEATYDIDNILENVDIIDEVVNPLFKECSNIKQLSSHLEKIENLKAVSEVWTTSNALYVRTPEGFQLSWVYTPEINNEITSKQYKTSDTPLYTSANYDTKSVSYDKHNTTHSYNNVCIINQTSNCDFRTTTQGIKSLCDSLEIAFDNNGFDAKRVDGSKVNFDFFENKITEYDIIFLITHGSYDGKGNHWLCTGQPYRKEELKSKLYGLITEYKDISLVNKMLEKFTIVELHGKDAVLVDYFSISEEYINHEIKGSLPNSIVFNIACESLKGSTDGQKLAMAFQGKGAAIYLGYDDVNNIGHKAGKEFFDNMIKGMTIEEAFNKLRGEYRQEIFYDSYLNLNTPMLKYIPEANKDICIAHLTPVTKDTTMVNGIPMLHGTFETPVKGQFENYELGFCYSYTTSIPTVEDSEAIYVENSDRYITENTDYYAELKDIQYDETCYYRFFFKNPHSGDYVYGNTLSFKLEMDKWVDLGLSVLWAAWNVGANSPNDLGGIYAWGEISEKDTYLFSTYQLVEERILYPGFVEREYLDVGDISGTKYDVAHKRWGNGARIPTPSEIRELVDKCKIEYYSSQANYIIGPNGNSILLPHSHYWASYYGDNSSEALSVWNYFRTGSVNVNGIIMLKHFGFLNLNSRLRCYGSAVRPVKNK